MTPVRLSRNEISQLTKLEGSGVTQKAHRQEWPYEEIKKSGKPSKYYYIATLPDDIQIKWIKSVIQNEDVASLKYALILPERKSYFSKTEKKYDGKSYGLCTEAIKILSTINIDELENEGNSFPFVPLHAPCLICPECNYGRYKEKEPDQSKNHCLYCGTKLIDQCPTCNEELQLPNQNFCNQGHQLRDNRVIPKHARQQTNATSKK